MSRTEQPVLYKTEGKIAHIILNRPEHLNAFTFDTPFLIRDFVEKANADPKIHVIILSGAGKAFCAGYDLKLFAETKGPTSGTQDMPWDPLVDYQMMGTFTKCFTSLWHSLKPVICKIQGFAVAGGSDIALCCDVLVMQEDAKIGYPPARVWGCPTTGMWVFKLGAERAKRMLLTGDLIDGETALQMGLVSYAVPASELDHTVQKLAERMASIPKNQLMMQKLMINSAYENMGLSTTQTLAVLFDGIARHNPEGVAFKKQSEEKGYKRAIFDRDNNSGSAVDDEKYPNGSREVADVVAKLLTSHIRTPKL